MEPWTGYWRAAEKGKGGHQPLGLAYLQTGWTSGSMTAAPIPSREVSNASGFAAGPMRKPETAHLMNWFYEIPPCRWFLLLRRIETRYRKSGLQSTICACQDRDVNTAILGPNVAEMFKNGTTCGVRDWAARRSPPERTKHHAVPGLLGVSTQGKRVAPGDSFNGPGTFRGNRPAGRRGDRTAGEAGV